MKFVSPGYQWPTGQEKLYLCMSPCKAKLQQGADKAADLTKIVNDLRAQHAGLNQSTSPVIEISAEELPPPSDRIDSLDDADLHQTHQSRLGKRKVPCELPYTPEVSKIPKIVGDAQGSMTRKRLSYGTPPTGAALGATPSSVKVARDGSCK